MNIPEEAAQRYPYSGTMNDHQQDVFREVFAAGAVWARKEALEEAAREVDRFTRSTSRVKANTLLAAAAYAVRKLAEGVSDGQQ